MKKHLLVLTSSLALSMAHSQQGWYYQNAALVNNSFGAICAINRDTAYVIADGGQFLRTYSGGISWSVLNSGISESFFDMSFIHHDTGYAVGRNGAIIKTLNSGTSWQLLASGVNEDLFSISIPSPDNIWIVGDSGLILNSRDYGTTWIKNDTLASNKLNSVCFRNPGIGFIAGSKGALFSTLNGGTDWDTIGIATNKDLFSVTMTGNNAFLLAGWDWGSYYSECDELFSTNDTTNWAGNNLFPVMPGLSRLYFINDSTGFAISSNTTTNNNRIIIIDKTTDYGQNWTKSLLDWNVPKKVGNGYSDIAFVNDSIGYVLCGNNILRTTDGGIFVDVEETDWNRDVEIFPNPFSIRTTLRADRPFKDAILTLYNSFGQQVRQMDNLSGQAIIIQRGNLPSGLYFIQLAQEGIVFTSEKVVIVD